MATERVLTRALVDGVEESNGRHRRGPGHRQPGRWRRDPPAADGRADRAGDRGDARRSPRCSVPRLSGSIRRGRICSAGWRRRSDWGDDRATRSAPTRLGATSWRDSSPGRASRSWSASSPRSPPARSASRSGWSRVTPAASIDRVVTWVVDVQMAVPFVVVAIALVAVLGAGLTTLLLTLAVTGWVGYARVVRLQAQALRRAPWVEAARAVGARAGAAARPPPPAEPGRAGHRRSPGSRWRR